VTVNCPLAFIQRIDKTTSIRYSTNFTKYSLSQFKKAANLMEVIVERAAKSSENQQDFHMLKSKKKPQQLLRLFLYTGYSLALVKEKR